MRIRKIISSSNIISTFSLALHRDLPSIAYTQPLLFRKKVSADEDKFSKLSLLIFVLVPFETEIDGCYCRYERRWNESISCTTYRINQDGKMGKFTEGKAVCMENVINSQTKKGFEERNDVRSG
jgi:hypothetical protein